MQAVKSRTAGTMVEVNPADSIEKVKERLQELEGIPPDQIRLVFRGLTPAEQAPFKKLLEEKREAAIRALEEKRVKNVMAAIKISRGIKRLRNTQPARTLLQTLKNEKVRSNASAKAAAEESNRTRNANQKAAEKAEKIRKLRALQTLQEQQAKALEQEEGRLQALLGKTVSSVAPVRTTPAAEGLHVNRALEALQRASDFGDSTVVPVVLSRSKHTPSEPSFTELKLSTGAPGGPGEPGGPGGVLHLFKEKKPPTNTPHTLHTAAAPPPPPPHGDDSYYEWWFGKRPAPVKATAVAPGTQPPKQAPAEVADRRYKVPGDVLRDRFLVQADMKVANKPTKNDPFGKNGKEFQHPETTDFIRQGERNPLVDAYVKYRGDKGNVLDIQRPHDWLASNRSLWHEDNNPKVGLRYGWWNDAAKLAEWRKQHHVPARGGGTRRRPRRHRGTRRR
jgi:hypothetical protein